MTRDERLDPALPMFPTPAHAKGPDHFADPGKAIRDAEWLALKAAAALRRPQWHPDTGEQQRPLGVCCYP